VKGDIIDEGPSKIVIGNLVKYLSSLPSASTEWKDFLRTTVPKAIVGLFVLKA